MKIKLFLSTLLAVLLLSGCQPGDNTSGNDNDSPAKKEASGKYTDTPQEGQTKEGQTEDGKDSADARTGDDNESPVKQEASGWYMKTTVEAQTADGKVYTHKSAGVFGALEESSDEKDRHDIKAFGSAAIYAVFVKEGWGEENGDYFSDYRHYAKGEGATRRVWTFQIKNETAKPDLSNASFKIGLKGPYDVFKKAEGIGYEEKQAVQNTLKSNLTLIDVDNGRQYSASEIETLQFGMNGSKVRTFRWVMGAVEPEDFEGLVQVATNNSLQMKSAAEEREPETKFGFPPAF